MTRTRKTSTTKNQWVYHDSRWKKVRAEAMRRAGGECEICGVDVRGKYKARVDHIYAVDTHIHLAFEITNVRVLCCTCDANRHSEKGSERTAKRVRIGYDGMPIE